MRQRCTNPANSLQLFDSFIVVSTSQPAAAALWIKVGKRKRYLVDVWFVSLFTLFYIKKLCIEIIKYDTNTLPEVRIMCACFMRRAAVPSVAVAVAALVVVVAVAASTMYDFNMLLVHTFFFSFCDSFLLHFILFLFFLFRFNISKPFTQPRSRLAHGTHPRARLCKIRWTWRSYGSSKKGTEA